MQKKGILFLFSTEKSKKIIKNFIFKNDHIKSVTKILFIIGGKIHE